ncbi:MAG TPA: BtpA/SgcQ family protein [Planctomycetota bacterium]|nr:BtpA/SgcQ family protein [Planctomycetota bacterium]
MIDAVFGRTRCALVGCVHLLPLPGSAGFTGDLDSVVQRATEEARLLEKAGFNALIVENTHDAPYLLGQVDPETTAALAVCARAVRETVKVPVGVQALAAANREALGVAIAAGCSFIRVENFAFAHVADEGLMATASAPELIRVRARLRAERILILADVKKKHASHAITADLTMEDAVHGAAFSRADAVVVTGLATGKAADLEDVRRARGPLPVFVGSGVTPANVAAYAALARGLIVGSTLKRDGDWKNELDPERTAALVAAFRSSAPL